MAASTRNTAAKWRPAWALGSASCLGQGEIEHQHQGAERWLSDAGITVEWLDDPHCVALMQRLQTEKPEIWREDIGLPPAHEP